MQTIVVILCVCVCVCRDLGLRLFESLIINHSRVLERVIDGIISLINKERCVWKKKKKINFVEMPM